MENTLFKFISASISALLLVFGISMFFSLFVDFFDMEINTGGVRFDSAENIEERVYTKADIYYIYTRYANDEGIDKFSDTYANEVDVSVDGSLLDFAASEEEILTWVSGFSANEYEKRCIYEQDKLARVEFVRKK